MSPDRGRVSGPRQPGQFTCQVLAKVGESAHAMRVLDRAGQIVAQEVGFAMAPPLRLAKLAELRHVARFADDAAGAVARAGVRTTARNLSEQIALAQARAGAGTRIMLGRINDPKYPEKLWAKIQHVHRSSDGTKITIHYWENLATGVREGFKFK